MNSDLIGTIAVTTCALDLIDRAKCLAKKLHLNFIQTDHDHYPYLLVLDYNQVAIHYSQDKKIKPLVVDFGSGPFGYRLQHAQGRNELIAKAVGIKKSYRPSVIDATAGLGRDGFLLSRLGCFVTMLERSPILFILLEDGLQRLKKEQDDLLNKMKFELIHTEAAEFLSQLDVSDYPDVIYLDPMFPERNKSALVKKEMRMLQDLVGDGLDSNQLFEIAQKKSKKRVVVKRPLHAPIINDKKPDLVYRGKSIRFDIYFPI